MAYERPSQKIHRALRPECMRDQRDHRQERGERGELSEFERGVECGLRHGGTPSASVMIMLCSSSVLVKPVQLRRCRALRMVNAAGREPAPEARRQQDPLP